MPLGWGAYPYPPVRIRLKPTRVAPEGTPKSAPGERGRLSYAPTEV